MRALAAIGLSLAATSCSGAASQAGRVFTANWQNDGGKGIAAVHAAVGSAPLAPGPGLAVGVTKSGLSAALLDGKGSWKYAGKVDALPTISGDVVVLTTGGEVVALDARTGAKLWSVSSQGRSLRGAGDDGSTTVVSLGAPGGGRSLLLAVVRDGKVTLKLEPEPEIGTPAIQGGIAFVPWSNQYVSAVDVAAGSEAGRLLLREQVSHAVNVAGKLYFGELSLIAFDERIGQATAGGATRVTLPMRELPGKPAWFTDGATVQPKSGTARERIRLYARPEGAAIGGGRFAATYFRVVMGLGATDATLNWVVTADSDVLGGAAAKGGFAFCTASGQVLLRDEAGGDAGSVSLGGEVSGCVVQAGSFALSTGKPPLPLAQQLARALEARSADMVVAQRFLLRELGALQDAFVTKVLIDLAENPRTPPLLLEDGRQLLAARRSGAEHMLEALSKHYDFLTDTVRPPPVGPLADALAAMNEKRGATLLAKHLNDPANSADDIQRAARALDKLADSSEADELKMFFALYRATADQKELVSAVISVARAIVRVGGDEGKRIVRDAARDPLTHPDIQAGLAPLVVPEPADKAAQQK